MRRRLSSPCVAALAAPALCPVRFGGAAVLPWARGKSRGRGVFASGWCWECTAGVVTQKCHLFFLSANDSETVHEFLKAKLLLKREAVIKGEKLILPGCHPRSHQGQLLCQLHCPDPRVVCRIWRAYSRSERGEHGRIGV
jgi:hypothetical protein